MTNHANIWAPWRMAYLRSQEEPGGTPAAGHRNFLQGYWQDPDSDEANLVVHRDRHGMILLNRYPYTNGHLLVALGQPAPKLGDYDPDQRAAFWNLIDLAGRLVHRTLNPQGLNIGINEGSAAGAGVPEHLHGHVVPRWGGDTNFMTVVGAVRVAPDALESVAADYRAAIERGLLEE